METLKAYISNVETLLLNQLSGKPKEFIELFRSNNYLSEEAFIADFCDEKHDRTYYADWKSRTIKILQTMAILSETKGGSEVKKKYDFCQKKFLLGQKLTMQGEKDEGMRLMKQAHKIATEYDFIHLACELSEILHHNYIYHNPNKRLANDYANQTELYLEDYIAEKKVKRHFLDLVEDINSAKRITRFEIVIEDIKKYKGRSIKYNFYLFSIIMLYQLQKGEYHQMIETCNKVLAFFETKNGTYPAYYLLFLRSKGTAQTAIGKYEDSGKSLTAAAQYTKNSPYNHYLLQFYKTLNALHAGQYEIAYNTFIKNKRCKIKQIKQQFIIIEAYLFFLIHTGYLQIEKGFRVGKYLNETIKGQQDKKGDNINILIAELLVYLVKDRDKFIDRVDAIKDYSYRHLKGDDSKRAKLFLKILCLMGHPKVNFHPVALQRKAGKYIELLRKHPVRMGENFAVEIIPFHHLLDMILERVMRKVA